MLENKKSNSSCCPSFSCTDYFKSMFSCLAQICCGTRPVGDTHVPRRFHEQNKTSARETQMHTFQKGSYEAPTPDEVLGNRHQSDQGTSGNENGSPRQEL